eukprot:484800_1
MPTTPFFKHSITTVTNTIVRMSNGNHINQPLNTIQITHGPINQPNQVINSICYKPLASTVIKQANWGNHYAIDSWDENNNNDDIKYDNNKEKELLENNNDINSDDEDNEKV